MTVNILAFGIAKVICGSPLVEIELTEGSTVNDLKSLVEKLYPRLKELGSYLIAVNNEYASADGIINQYDEVAIIPPVSGG